MLKYGFRRKKDDLSAEIFKNLQFWSINPALEKQKAERAAF